MNKNRLSVRLNGQPIGILEKTEQKKLHFSYRNDAKSALSLSLPLKEKVFDHMACETYFGGLLPSAESFRQPLANVHGIDIKDTFSFLAHHGAECMGQVSFHFLSEPHDELKERPYDARLLSHHDFKEAIQKSLHTPLFYSFYEHYPLLSGNHPKVGICFKEHKIALPIHGGLSTHLLKYHGDENSVLNQYFCLKMARYAGIEVPEFALLHCVDQWMLVEQRVDRKIEVNKIKRLHHQDLCQALNVRWMRQREQDKGPSMKDLFEVANKTRVPAKTRHDLIHLILFNDAINHTSAHGKHFSLLQDENGLYFSPFYGFYSDYQNVSPLAMRIGGNANGMTLQDEDWKWFCKKIEYSWPIFKAIRKERQSIYKMALEQAFDDFKKEHLSLLVPNAIKQCVLAKLSKMTSSSSR